jgi:hypothetical protein
MMVSIPLSFSLGLSFSLFKGICNETSSATFYCFCKPGWEGDHCERKINYCWNVTCQNNGVCRPLFMDYKCECIRKPYSGRHCEIRGSGTIIHQSTTNCFVSLVVIATILLSYIHPHDEYIDILF